MRIVPPRRLQTRANQGPETSVNHNTTLESAFLTGNALKDNDRWCPSNHPRGGAAGPPCHFPCPKPCNFQCPKPCNFRCPLTTGAMGGAAPRERGRPARTALARPRPTPRPGSTRNGPGTLLRPGPWRSRRMSGRVPHPREPERHATGVHAGGTPALPRGLHPMTSAQQRRSIRLCWRSPVFPRNRPPGSGQASQQPGDTGRTAG